MSSPVADAKGSIANTGAEGLHGMPNSPCDQDQILTNSSSMEGMNHKTVKDLVSKIETSDIINRGIISSTIKSPLQTVNDKKVAKVCEEAPETPDSQCEVISKYKKYVKRIRSKVCTRESWRSERLFHCCLIVALNRRTPYIKEKFPEHVEVPRKIEELCFPDISSGPVDCTDSAQCYSLVITNELGERTFGYCRRVLPEGSTQCLPIAYCLLSKRRAPGFYKRVLEELESRHGFPDRVRMAILHELYSCMFPQPGEAVEIDCSRFLAVEGSDLKLNDSDVFNESDISCDSDCNKNNYPGRENGGVVYVSNNGEYGTLYKKGRKSNLELRFNEESNNKYIKDLSVFVNHCTPMVPELKRSNSSPSLSSEEIEASEFTLRRPQDSRHEEDNLRKLHETLSPSILLQVFSSLLLERKVILISCELSKLSSCIEALQVILYPFSWQHTIIPVVPKSLWEILEAPTPLVCGVLSAEVVNTFKIEHGIVVDLDEGDILQNMGDEGTILPYCLVETWKNGLALANTAGAQQGGTHNIFLSDAFLRVFVQSCGHYQDYIADGKFQKADFVQGGKTRGKSIRRFLQWFTETTMFFNFSETALEYPEDLHLFNQRIQIYTSDSTTNILRKMKYWTREKSFFH